MPNFTVYVDHKITIWERCKWDIEAKTEREANDIAKQIWDDQEAAHERPDYSGVEYLADTAECLTPEENGGEPTEELLLDKYVILKNA